MMRVFVSVIPLVFTASVQDDCDRFCEQISGGNACHMRTFCTSSGVCQSLYWTDHGKLTAFNGFSSSHFPVRCDEATARLSSTARVRTVEVDNVEVERVKEVHFRDTNDEESNSLQLGSIKRLKVAHPSELASFAIPDTFINDPSIELLNSLDINPLKRRFGAFPDDRATGPSDLATIELPDPVFDDVPAGPRNQLKRSFRDVSDNQSDDESLDSVSESGSEDESDPDGNEEAGAQYILSTDSSLKPPIGLKRTREVSPDCVVSLFQAEELVNSAPVHSRVTEDYSEDEEELIALFEFCNTLELSSPLDTEDLEVEGRIARPPSRASRTPFAP